MSKSQLTRAIPGELSYWRYCPSCAGDISFVQAEDGAQPSAKCSECGKSYYAGPRPTASVIAQRDDGKILLVRRAIEPFKGYWDLPGGFVDHDELPESAAVRELTEETGLHGEVTQSVGMYLDYYETTQATTLNHFYLLYVSDISTAAAASDVAELGWFDMSEIPYAELAFDCVPRVLQELSSN